MKIVTKVTIPELLFLVFVIHSVMEKRGDRTFDLVEVSELSFLDSGEYVPLILAKLSSTDHARPIIEKLKKCIPHTWQKVVYLSVLEIEFLHVVSLSVTYWDDPLTLEQLTGAVDKMEAKRRTNETRNRVGLIKMAILWAYREQVNQKSPA